MGQRGSDLIEYMSQRYGIADLPRNAGPKFIAGFLADMNGQVGNGVIDPAPSQAVVEFQRRLNEGHF